MTKRLQQDGPEPADIGAPWRAALAMAWQAQGWALKVALVGQGCFLLALAIGLGQGSLAAAGWSVSLVMAGFFGWYFWRLATWPVAAAT